MCIIAPSLLEADYQRLGEQLGRIEAAGAEYVHIDVMDGNFVPNISFGMKMIKGLRDASGLVFDVHMMVQEPIRFVEKVKDAGADYMIVHYEACGDILKTLKEIKHADMCAGIALNPETQEDVISEDILQMADVIHVMTSVPGREGEPFIAKSLDKIRRIRKRVEGQGTDQKIETDGCITFDNVSKVVQAGADIIVSGKALFYGDLEENIRRMRMLAERVSCVGGEA